jgi:hypothetical protein
MRRRTHGHHDASRSGRHQLSGGLGSSVAGTNDDHIESSKLSTARIVGDMQNQAGEVAEAWKVGDVGKLVVARRHHDGGGAVDRTFGRGHSPAGGSSAIFDPSHRGDRGTETHIDARSILLEVPHKIRACNVGSVLAGDDLAGQFRETSHRVQAKALPVCAPTRAHCGALLEHQHPSAHAHQLMGCGETSGAGANDDDIDAVPLVDHQSVMSWAARSAMANTVALVFPETGDGMMDASATRRREIPRTRSCGSTTARSSVPIRQVPA